MPSPTPPVLPPFIINGSGANKYVLTYKNVWDPVKKHPSRVKGDSRSVGKCLPVAGKTDCVEIIFKEDFKARYPELHHYRVSATRAAGWSLCRLLTGRHRNLSRKNSGGAKTQQPKAPLPRW